MVPTTLRPYGLSNDDLENFYYHYPARTLGASAMIGRNLLPAAFVAWNAETGAFTWGPFVHLSHAGDWPQFVPWPMP
jgi:hypothetical protein